MCDTYQPTQGPRRFLPNCTCRSPVNEVKTNSRVEKSKVFVPNPNELMARLSNEPWERAIGMLQFGQMQRQAAWHFGCSVKTINHLWQRFNQTGTTSDHPDLGDHVLPPLGKITGYGCCIYATGSFLQW